MANKAPEVTRLSLPKGGGAVRGIGETFRSNEFTGTASFSIPVHTTPCRDFEPHLSLDYDSGTGNGPFGVGFQLVIPNVSRKTEHGRPKYDDSDTYLLSGSDDLVPQLVKPRDRWIPHTPNAVTEGRADYRVKRFQPRTEGLFARIERWVRSSEGDTHWRVTTSDCQSALNIDP